MTEKGINNQRQLSRLIGIPPTTISGWFNAGRLPDYSAIGKLANFFDVSADYLLGLEDDFGVRGAAPNGESMTANERELLETFRTLSPYLQGLTLDTVRSFAGNNNNDLHKKA